MDPGSYKVRNYLPSDTAS